MSESGIKLRPYTSAQVRADWGWIRNGLQEILKRTGEVWMPEDVWTALQSNQAFLWAIEKDGDDPGFMVLRKDLDADGPVLYIWIIWCKPQSMRHCHGEVFTRLDEIAARIGAKRLRFQSPRKGWTGFDQYFTAVQTVYERELKT